MKLVAAGLLFLVSMVASAQQCFGPGGCQPAPEVPMPDQACIGSGCSPVDYIVVGRFVVARAVVPHTDYVQLGWSGPCDNDDVLTCTGLWIQAAHDLEMNLYRSNRALRQ